MCWRGGAGLCGAAMATGPFNESECAVTNDIPEPIGYNAANGQFAASLTQQRDTTMYHRGQTSTTFSHPLCMSGNILGSADRFVLYIYIYIYIYILGGHTYVQHQVM